MNLIHRSVLLIASFNMSFYQIKYETYQNAIEGITIDYPTTWQYQSNPRTSFIFMRSLETGMMFRENINLIISSNINLSLKEYVGASKVQLGTQLSSYKELSTDYIDHNGNNYARIIYEHKINNFPLKVAYYITLKHKKSYCITCSSTNVNFNIYYPMFERMVQSFKIL